MILLPSFTKKADFLNEDLYNKKYYNIATIAMPLIGPWLVLFFGWLLKNRFFIW
jgi:hypothetical protein